MATILEIPLEILEQIAAYLPSPASCSNALTNLATSCKFLNSTLAPLLFHSFSHSSKFRFDPESQSPLFDKLVKYVRKYSAYVDGNKPDPLPAPNATYLEITHSVQDHIGDPVHFFATASNIYTRLTTIKLFFIDYDIEYTSFLSAISELCSNNVLLTSVSFRFQNRGTEAPFPKTPDVANKFEQSVSSLKRLTKFSIISDHILSIHMRTFQSIIANAFLKIETLSDVHLRLHLNAFHTSEKSILHLLSTNKVQKLKIEGVYQYSIDFITTIKNCASLTHLYVKIKPKDLQQLLSGHTLPKYLAILTVGSSKSETDFATDFSGVEYFEITAQDEIPFCVYRDLQNSTTLKEIKFLAYNVDEYFLTGLHDVVTTVESLTTVNFDFNVKVSEENLKYLLGLLRDNRRIRKLNFNLYCDEHNVLPRLNEMLSGNTFLREVYVTNYSGQFDIFSLISAVLQNPRSVIKRITLIESEISKLAIEFWWKGERRERPVLVLSQNSRRDLYGILEEILEVVKSWETMDGRSWLVDQIVLQLLTNFEMKELVKALEIEERMERDRRIKLGYKDGSMCLWFNPDI